MSPSPEPRAPGPPDADLPTVGPMVNFPRTMSALLETPARATRPLSPSPFRQDGAEERWLEQVARLAEAPELRAQALIELMARAVDQDDELGFERLRHELADATLPPALASLFHAHVAWGLVTFERGAAARRWLAHPPAPVAPASVGEWLIEFERRIGPPPR